jgi:hypothetical protein
VSNILICHSIVNGRPRSIVWYVVKKTARPGICRGE